MSEEKLDQILAVSKTTAKDIKVIKDKLSALEKGESLLRLENKKTKIEMENIRYEIKYHNVIFHGVKEIENDRDELEEIVIDDVINRMMKVNLNLDDIDLAKRLGPKRNEKIRPILVRFMRQKHRDNVIRNRGKLQGTPMYVTEDLPEQMREKEKSLVPTMKEQRQEGKYAVLRRGKLYVEGIEFFEGMPDEMKKLIEERAAKRNLTKSNLKINRQKSEHSEEDEDNKQEEENDATERQREYGAREKKNKERANTRNNAPVYKQSERLRKLNESKQKTILDSFPVNRGGSSSNKHKS